MICRNRSNWPEQEVITDPMVKGLIPHGLLHRIVEANHQWVRQQAAAEHFNECTGTHPDELAEAVAQCFTTSMQSLLDDSITNGSAYASKADNADDSSSEDGSHDGGNDDIAGVVDEAQFDTDGLRVDVSPKPLRDVIPTYKVSDSPVHELFRFLPEHWRKHGELDTITPWSIIFTDNIEVAHGEGFETTKLLVVYDLATNGIRVKPFKRKYDLGIIFDEIIIEESLDKRTTRVTVGADGDGAMKLVKEACRKRGVNWLDIPPWSPHLNPVEGAIGHFKQTMASVLLAACTRDGPLTPRLAHHAATYVAYVNERFSARRIDDSYRGEYSFYKSPWELNVGVKPSTERLVPWGCAGYAFVPEALRKARGAPKYLRTEPVLLIGYQHFYTNVYKMLTRHGTIIHGEQVVWDMDANLGEFLPVERIKTDAALKRYRVNEVMPDLINQAADNIVPSKRTSKAATQEQAASFNRKPQTAVSDVSSEGARAVLRLNISKALGSKGPAPYILHRCEQLDGIALEDATGKRFEDSKGKQRPYRKQDLDYDLSRGWLEVKIEPVSKDSSGAAALMTTAYGRWGHHSVAHYVKAFGTTYSDHDRLTNVLSAHAFLAMKDMKWKEHLNGPDHEAIMGAYAKEWDALKSSVLTELFEGDAEFEDAKKLATKGRLILEFKRVGVWKTRCVVRGDLEDKVRLDGPDYNYASNVCEFTAVRNLLFAPRYDPTKLGSDSDKIVVAQCDIAVAYTQAELFGPDEPARYLKVLDPVTQQWRYFRQIGNLYGSASSGKRWEITLNKFLLSDEVGFQQGKNEPCAFYHPTRDMCILTYCDDLLCRGKLSDIRWFFDKLGKRFNIKPPAYLSRTDMMDHLGMVFFEAEEGTYLSMQNYVEVMCQRLGININKYKQKPRHLPMSAAITDLQPCTPEECKLFMSAAGMVGWISGTGRPECRVYHSRVSQYMAAPVKGALKAVLGIAKYLASTSTLCLFQPWYDGSDENFKWRFFSDSDQSSNPEVVAKRKSQLSYIAVRGKAPITFGSKSSAVQLPPGYDSFDVDHHGLSRPVCHPLMKDIHADVSSAAAEVYAASVALNEFLHLSYISDEMGFKCPMPILLEVDNQTAIHFSKGRTPRSKLKHIDARQAWVEALRNEDIVKLVWVPTGENLADLNSKLMLNRAVFEYLRSHILHAKAIPSLVAAVASKELGGKQGAGEGHSRAKAANAVTSKGFMPQAFPKK